MESMIRKMAAKRIVTAVALCALMAVNAFAEGGNPPKLYKSKEVQAAYRNGTRSETGKPGHSYWQNRADYSITATVEPSSRLLTGAQRVVYWNNSPDTLKWMFVQLYPNMNKKGGIRNTELVPDAVTDGMLVRSVAVDGKEYHTGPDSKFVAIEGTVMRIRLQKPIAPHSKAEAAFEWSFTIPSGSNVRMGAYPNGTIYLGYWYPKIAVYDDVYGWDRTTHDGEHEFYHDYGDYEVALTVPDGYGVWGTGILQNASDVLQKPVLERYNAASKSAGVVNIIAKDDILAGACFVKHSGTTVWKYKADYVSDVAFGISNDYLWDAVSVELPGGRTAMAHAVYDTSAHEFKTVADEAKQTLEYLSKTVPGVPYPYPQITVFNGDEGMEYPMIVNDGVFHDRITDVYVHAHEISHQYFPFYVGTNETMNAWLDEGWAYALPVGIQQELSNYDHRIRAAKGYEKWAGSRFDMPLMTPSISFRDVHMQMVSYFKPSVAYEMLRSAIGDENFYKGLREFIDRWKGKHPLPYDFFNTFNDVAGQNLSWFWKPWFFEQGVPDLGVKAVKTEGGKVRVCIEKVGLLPVPVSVTVKFKSGKSIELTKPASVWSAGAPEIWLETPGGEELSSVALGSLYIPDSNPANDTWKAE